MDAEKIQEKRAQVAEEHRLVQQTSRIILAINKQTTTITDKLDELITAIKDDQKEEDGEESQPETLTS